MNIETLKNELQYSAVRSGGPGGQHANKVSSKVVALFDIEASQALSEIERLRIMEKLASRLNKKNQFILTCDESRSQHKNKQIVTNRMVLLLEAALKLEKKRISIKVGKKQKTIRLDAKKRKSTKKTLRQKPRLED